MICAYCGKDAMKVEIRGDDDTLYSCPRCHADCERDAAGYHWTKPGRVPFTMAHGHVRPGQKQIEIYQHFAQFTSGLEVDRMSDQAFAFKMSGAWHSLRATVDFFDEFFGIDYTQLVPAVADATIDNQAIKWYAMRFMHACNAYDADWMRNNALMLKQSEMLSMVLTGITFDENVKRSVGMVRKWLREDLLHNTGLPAAQ